jgi:hypothetical protein
MYHVVALLQRVLYAPSMCVCVLQVSVRIYVYIGGWGG